MILYEIHTIASRGLSIDAHSEIACLRTITTFINSESFILMIDSFWSDLVSSITWTAFLITLQIKISAVSVFLEANHHSIITHIITLDKKTLK